MAENKERSCYTCFHRPACAGMMEAQGLADYVSLGPQSSGRCPDYIFSGDVFAVPQWIPVSERLPEKNDQWVLCLCVSGAIEVLKFDYTMWNWDAQYPGRCYMENYVTHWMPLPELPKEVPENETL